MAQNTFGRAFVLLMTCALTLLLAGSTFAQRPLTAAERQQQEDAAQACAMCGSCGVVGIVVMIVVAIAIIVLDIALLIWVARDAKSRGMDSAVMWMALVFFTNILGLVIYIFSRPQGQLIRCPHCQNSRLMASAICPHCGNP